MAGGSKVFEDMVLEKWGTTSHMYYVTVLRRSVFGCVQ